MSSKHIKPPAVHEEAARWAQGFDGDDPQEREEFLRWVGQSPREGTELMVADLLIQELNQIDPERTIDVEALIAQAKSNVSPIGPHVDIGALPTKRQPIPKMGWVVASAASITAVVALSWAYHAAVPPTYRTAVGEQRVVTLDDGSVLTLNTHSRVEVRYSARSRDIYLTQGQAAFRVAHEATRPFYVHAGAAEIRDIGTEFDVRYFSETNKVVLAVTEGVVQVSGAGPKRAPAAAPSTIAAGQRTVIDPNGTIEPVVSVDTNDVSAWKEQRLKFLDTPLEEIAAEFNRYNRKPKLHVEGDMAKAKRFNGNFLAHSFDSLFKSLESEGLSYERRGNEVIIRSPADSGTNATVNP